MPFIRLTYFKGVIPRLAARVLPSNNAQIAINCDLQSGELRALKENVIVNTPTKVGIKLSIYKWLNFWFHWTTDVDVARSPITGDTTERIYFTGDGVPKMTFSPVATSGGGTDYPAASYNLGVPAPTAPLTAAVVVNSGAITGATQTNPVVINAVAHGRTTAEQIEISGIAGMTEINGQTFLLTVIDADNYSLDGEDGTAYTAYVSGGTWTQTYDAADVRKRFYEYNYVSSSGEEGPPSAISNTVIVGPNQQVNLTGIAVGPTGAYDISLKRIYRSVSDESQFTIDIPLASSTFSDTIDDADLGEIMPSSKWVPPPPGLSGIIILPNGVAAGFVGKDLYLSVPYQPHAWPLRYIKTFDYKIVAISGVGTDIIVATEGTPYIVTGIDPETAFDEKIELEASCVSKRSMASLGNFAAWATPDGLAVVGSGAQQIVTRMLMDPEDWQSLNPSSIHGYLWRGRYVGFYDTGLIKGGFIFDPRPGEEQLVFIDDYATAGFYDRLGGNLYLQIGDNIELFGGGAADKIITWKSKKEYMPEKNFSAGKIEAEGYPLFMDLIADGVVRHTQTVENDEIFRMPSGYRSKEIEIQVRGATGNDLAIKTAVIATSISEIKRAIGA